MESVRNGIRNSLWRDDDTKGLVAVVGSFPAPPLLTDEWIENEIDEIVDGDMVEVSLGDAAVTEGGPLIELTVFECGFALLLNERTGEIWPDEVDNEEAVNDEWWAIYAVKPVLKSMESLPMISVEVSGDDEEAGDEDPTAETEEDGEER